MHLERFDVNTKSSNKSFYVKIKFQEGGLGGNGKNLNMGFI
jgi:hypothetical protein